MLLTAVLGAIALLILIASPAVLALRPWQLRHPRTALTIWYASVAAGTLFALGAVACTVICACTASGHATAREHAAIHLAAWLLLGAVGAIVGFVITTATSRSSQGFRRDLALSREEGEEFTLVRFEDKVPHAYSVPSSPPEIFFSTALRDSLSRAEFTAVIAHEYAHLWQRHDIAVRIAELNAVCLPFLPAGRGLRRATRLLIELAADDAAARQVGPAHVASALTRLAEHTGEIAMAIRAERLRDKKWPIARRRRLPRALRAVAAHPRPAEYRGRSRG